jgi:ABC-type antimicrobial peptide transport system permease subunit
MRYLWRTFLLALRALQRNILRSALTTLGIVIGVAAVIAMVEIGQGSSSAVQKTISSMGADNILIYPGNSSFGGVSLGAGSVMTLTPDDAEAIKDNCPSVTRIAPLVRVRMQVVAGNRNWLPQQSIYGTTPEYLAVRDWDELAEGEPFTDSDVTSAAKVCLLGATGARELFGDESAVGKDVRVANVTLKVKGVLSRKGANMMGFDQDDTMIAPWTTIKFRVSGNNASVTNQSAAATGTTTTTGNRLYPSAGMTLYPVPSAAQTANMPQVVKSVNVDSILVRAASTNEIPTAMKQMTEIMRERHRLAPREPNDFTLRDMTEMSRALASTSRLMAGLLMIVATISLVVGGVGIMNIMLVSVTERTKEIGLRMAVGARPRDILRQFLVESVLLCLLGGAIGILLGWFVSFLVRVCLGWATETSWVAVIASVAVSCLVGVAFGYYPAWKASRLDPIDALRYE